MTGRAYIFTRSLDLNEILGSTEGWCSIPIVMVSAAAILTVSPTVTAACLRESRHRESTWHTSCCIKRAMSVSATPLRLKRVAASMSTDQIEIGASAADDDFRVAVTA